jgi:hypothetical protein
MRKSVITVTIESEFFEDNGVQMIKRVLKENDVTLYENVFEESAKLYREPVENFLKLIHKLKNPTIVDDDD